MESEIYPRFLKSHFWHNELVGLLRPKEKLSLEEVQKLQV